MSASRRQLLLTGAATLLLAQPAGAAERPDVELLEDLLALEQRLQSAYEAALRRGLVAPELGELLLDHEREHRRALLDTLAAAGRRNPRASVPAPALAGALRSRSAFASFALLVEAEAVAAYAEAAAVIRDPDLRQPLGSIMACEAAHEVALRDALRGRSLLD